MSSESSKAMILPRPLQPGDTIGIVAPAAAIDRDALSGGCNQLRALGYKTFFLDSIFDRDGYFAGTVERRLGELHEMFRRLEVNAIVAARGGFGCSYLLPHLDVDLIKNNPKPLIGYSDLTSLHTWLNDQGMMTFHGPMIAKDFSNANGVDVSAWRHVLGGDAYSIDLPTSATVKCIHEGLAEGQLYGGCLSLVVESLGTPYEIHTDGKILYLEDTGVWPYQVDRMLMHLELAGKFDGVLGVIFGDMAGCVQEEVPGYTVESIARRILANAQIPICLGMQSGHVKRDNITLPMGSPVALSVTASKVRLDLKKWSTE